MKWFLEGLKKYAIVTGRSRRKEYWLFSLWVLIFGVLLSLISFLIARIANYDTVKFSNMVHLIYSITVFFPSFSVTVRRLHDTGRSGIIFILVFIPVVNLYLLYLLLKAGDIGPNEYGNDPKWNENSELTAKNIETKE
jgi:uncharacterized membrane protein YhaH (DUF805 family)